MSELFRKIKFCEDCLLGGGFSSTVRDEIQRVGNRNCGFYIVPELLNDKSYSFGVGEGHFF